MSQKIAAATATNAQLDASLRIAKSQAESMKQQIAKRKHDVATALADSKAINAKLIKRVVALEKQLESLNVRMAEKPTENQVQ